MSRAVAITGWSVLCAAGHDPDAFWASLVAGRSPVGPLQRIDVSGLPVAFGAEDRGFDPAPFLGRREARMDRAAQYALVASALALKSAGLDGPEVARDRAGCFIGTSRGAADLLERAHAAFLREGARGVSPHASPFTTAGNIPGAAAARFGLRGPTCAVSSTCASAAHAIGMAAQQIRLGRADWMLAGGTEACLTPFCMAQFAAAGILSTRSADPARACRPFDRGRDGIVVGEGAGMFVLEEAEHARRRDAPVLAEIAGFGAACDAAGLVSIPERGDGLARAMREAMQDAGVSPADVGYVHAHGTATPLNDRAETAAIKAALGPDALRVPVSSTKSVTGHLLGAAGALGVAACVLAIRRRTLPPTINYEEPDPACDLDYVPNRPREQAVRVALANASGFGGAHACLAIRAV